jgi:hypothetical protein
MTSLVLLALLTFLRQGAWAQEASEDAARSDRRAAELLRAGNKAFKEGDFAGAEAAYRAALAFKKGYDIAGNLGMALLALGKQREAAQHLALSLRMFPVTGEPAARAEMQKALDRCRQEVGAVRLTVDVKGALVLVDGVAVGEEPLEDDVFVDPGDHVIEATRAGYFGARRTVSAAKGDGVDVALSLTPIPPPAPRQAPPATPLYRQWGLAPGVGLAAGGFVGIVGGAAFLGASSGRRAAAGALGAQILAGHGSCVGGASNYDGVRCPALAGALRADDALHDVGVGALLLGSAAAVGAAGYFLLPIPPRPRATGRFLRVTPVAAAGQGGVTLVGAF